MLVFCNPPCNHVYLISTGRVNTEPEIQRNRERERERDRQTEGEKNEGALKSNDKNLH